MEPLLVRPRSFLYSELDFDIGMIFLSGKNIMFEPLTTLLVVRTGLDWYGQNTESIASEICGFITVLTGTVILHATREEEETSSGTLRW